MMEELPPDGSFDSDLEYKIEQYDSQEEYKAERVMESPPIGYSQNPDEDYNIEDVATQIDIKSSSCKDNETGLNSTAVAGHLRESDATKEYSSTVNAASTSRKGNDVVIDIEYDIDDGPNEDYPVKLVDTRNQTYSEEFPEEDDAILVSAAENIEGLESCNNTGRDPLSQENLPEEEFEFPNDGQTDSDTLDPKLIVEDSVRKKEVENFRQFKPMEKIFPDVRYSEYNTVTFLIKQNYTPMDPLEPNPPKCVTKWDPKFVPMPFCDENSMIARIRSTANVSEGTEESTGSATATSSHFGAVPKKIYIWDRIVQTLTSFPLFTVEEIGYALKRYCARMNAELKALSYCCEQIMSSEERDNFFFKVIPFMSSLVLQTSSIVTCPLPFLRKNVNHNISISQRQVACLLANAFFCTFPKRFKSELDMSSINFKELFMEEDERIMKIKAQKIRCLIHYFTRIEADLPSGVVTYTRKNLRHSNMPEWAKLDKELTKMVPLIKGTIEDDGAGMLKVDFANSFIGGGALGRGAVQEEILFMIYPELILSRLFSEKLNSNEAVIITGCERFCSYQGYASSFKFDGDYQDATPYDCKGRRCTQIVAIDALYISRPSFQYHPKHITRELNKAYVGFASPSNQPVAVATGKWGCGAFNGDPQLKTIIQWLAASNAGRNVAFFTFGDLNCLNDILSICDSLHNMKIKDVWNLLCQYHTICCTTGKPNRSLRDFCTQYADGQALYVQEEEERQKASSSVKLKEVPITHFYSTEKRPLPPALDDSNVTDLISGIDKINSPEKPLPQTKIPFGKRQREEDSTGLTEDEITKELSESQDNVQPLEQPAPEKSKQVKGLKGGNPNQKPTATPNSSKRPKTLLDFYAESQK